MSQETEAADAKKWIISTGVQVGTQVKTKFMKQFITEVSPTGLYMLDGDAAASRIQVAAKFIEATGTKDVIVCSSAKYAQTPIERFCECTGAVSMLSRFMPGTLTNPSLPYYIEPKLLLVSDPQIDAQAVIEATNAGIPVIGISNSDNITSKLDVIIPANNRGRTSLAAVYWLLMREILTARGQGANLQYGIDDFETKIIDEAAAE